MQDPVNNPTNTTPQEDNQNLVARVIDKIATCENILVALSRNPSVDEIAAAIGLAIFLEEAGKRVTAIYSGETPNVLEFLKPEETFETNTDSLQDFIIALDKEKADHLRYKIDGDYVKVYVTPYKTKLEEDDLEFSYGDYNIDLVIALNVPTASDLDAALSEHGRIMHDASAIDVTTAEPGRFGEIEWSDTNLSSVSEMIANLLMAIKKPEIKKDVATALLTGIVAATNRFSNENTKSSTMVMASKLMDCGASEQLVAMNMMENTPVDLIGAVDINSGQKSNNTATNDGVLSVSHEEDNTAQDAAPVVNEQPVENTGEVTAESEPVAVANEAQPAMQAPELDYGKMMEEALAESLPTAENPLEVSTENPAMAMAPEVPSAPEENHIPDMQYASTEPVAEENVVPTPVANAAMMPEDNTFETSEPMGVGEDSYLINEPPKVVSPLPMPEDDGVLPPPPVPDLDFDAVPPVAPEMPVEASVLPEVQPVAGQPSLVATQPVEQPVVPVEQQPTDAFQIPNV